MCTWQLTMRDKERNTHHGQGYTVGVGVGVTAIIIALALLALGAFIYIKKKRKVLVQPPVVATPTVHLSNYEVEGKTGNLKVSRLITKQLQELERIVSNKEVVTKQRAMSISHLHLQHTAIWLAALQLL